MQVIWTFHFIYFVSSLHTVITIYTTICQYCKLNSLHQEVYQIQWEVNWFFVFILQEELVSLRFKTDEVIRENMRLQEELKATVVRGLLEEKEDVQVIYCREYFKVKALTCEKINFCLFISQDLSITFHL